MKNRFLTTADYCENAAQTVYLYKKLWVAESTALLHAPCEPDKSGLALDIACDIAKTGSQVVYVACERRIDAHIDTLAQAPTARNLYNSTERLVEDQPSLEPSDLHRSCATQIRPALTQVARKSVPRRQRVWAVNHPPLN